ncbi:hypothetical protein ACFYVL_08795 [Streptomyces sp. NPDC004111]|uniref:hypothetical protein n=1 Tax=Streptomyces sp. NPDC004111 TaxID=3364690 RepID=UPI00367CEC49
MRTTAVWPPTTHDHASLVHAYATVLRWPLSVNGHAATEHTARELADDKAALVHTECTAFDAVSVPRAAGRDALLRLDRRDLLVPSLLAADQVVMLVAPGTGVPLGDLPGVEVASGAGACVLLPPTAGVRWDNVPWSDTDPAPLGLTDGQRVCASLTEGLRIYGPSARPNVAPASNRMIVAGRSGAVLAQVRASQRAGR